MSSLKDIYNALKGDGQFTQTKDYGTFARRMNERGYSMQIYNNLKDSGATLPDIGTFRKRLGVHVWTADEARAQNNPTQKRNTPLGRAQQSVAQDRWGQQNDSELVQSLKTGQQAETPIDYTKPTAVRQIAGQERQRQQNLGKHVEYAGRVAASKERRRREQPMVDTGNEAVNRNVIKTQGQLEDEIEKSGKDFAKDNFSAYIANSIFGERKAAEERGVQRASQLGMSGMFGMFGLYTQIAQGAAYNKEVDPDKILGALTKKVQDETATLFSRPGMKEEITDKAAYFNMSPDEYVQRVLAPSLQERMAEEFDKSELAKQMPKSTAEYVLRGMNDSLIGTILQMVTMSKSQREYNQRAMAMTDEGLNPEMSKPGMWAKAGRGAVGFATDAPVFGGFGKVGAAASGRMLGNATAQGMRIANTGLAGRIGRMAAQGSVSQGVTGVLYGVTNAAVQNYSTGDDTSIGNTVKLMAKGGLSEGASWATMGGIGGTVGGVLYKVDGAKRLVAKPFQIAMEGIGMHLGGNVAKSIEGEKTDWLSVEGNLQDVANVVVLKLSHGLPKRAKVDGKKEGYLDFVARNLKDAMTSDATRAKAQGMVFTEEEKRQLFGAKDAPNRRKLRLTDDEYRQTGDNEVTFVPGDNLQESLTHWAMRTKRSGAKANGGESYKDTDVEFVRTAYDKIMADNTIPWDTKAKFNALVMGTTPSARPMMSYGRIEKDADGDFVGEYSKYGELLSKTYYKTPDERAAISYRLNARREDQRLQNAYGAAQIKDEATSEQTVKAVGEEYGFTVEQMKEAMDKDPLRRTDEEQKACIALREAFESGQFKPGTLHAEQSELQGNDVVERNGLGTERPNNEAVVDTMGELTRAENALQEAMDGNDTFKQEYERLSKQGLNNVQIYQELINSGVTQDELVPLADYINANAKVQGMFKGVQQKIEETVQQRVADWGYKGKLNGEKADGGSMLYVTDNKGRTLIVGAGDIAFGSDGRATGGDMITVLDPQTNEMDFISAKDVKMLRTETGEDYANAFRQRLQEINSEGYQAAAQQQAVTNISGEGEVKSEAVGGQTPETPESLSASEPKNEAVDNANYEVANSLREKVGQPLTKDEAGSLVEELEKRAEPARELPLTPENWTAEFGEDGKVNTPLGEVKMGENQITKLFEKGRSKEFSMIKPTLEDPDLVIETASEAADGNTERPSSYMFIKTFTKPNGEKVYYFKSVTIKKDGLEISVSSHFDRKKRVEDALEKGKLLYLKKGGAQTEQLQQTVSGATLREGNAGLDVDASSPNSSDRHLAEHQDGVPDLLPTQGDNANGNTGLHPNAQNGESVPLGDSRAATQADNATAPLGINSPNTSLGKDSESSAHGKGEKQTLTFADGTPMEVDKKGNAIYEKTSVENTVSDLFGRLKLENDEAEGFVAAKRKKAEDTLKKLEGKKPKISDDISKYQKEKKAWQESMNVAKQSAEYWKEVAQEIERVTTPDDAKGWQKELSGEAAHEEYEQQGGDGGELPIAEDFAAQFISGAKITAESFKAETGFGNAEMRKFVGMISKDGKSIKRLAEELMSIDSDEYGGMYFHGDDNAARSAIIEALTSAKSKGDLKNRMSDKEAKFTEQRNEDRDRAFMEKYHMSYEDYVKASEQELPELLRKAADSDAAFEDMMNTIRFQIKTPAQREAAENAYKWATENRPDEHKQYALVDMNRPNGVPEYFEKKELAKRMKGYYGQREMGNYKLFDLDKTFEDNVKTLKGKFPDEFDTRPESVKAKEKAAAEAQHRETVLRDTVVDIMKKHGLDVSMSAEEGQRVLDEANGGNAEVRTQARLNTLTKAANAIKGWIKSGKRGKSFTIELPEATQQMIRKVMGRDFDSHNITANGVAHAQKNHGVDGNKLNENSIPLTDKDMELMPYIMTAPDYVRKGSSDVTGRTSVRFYKDLSNGYVVVAEKEYKNSPDDMETITMWAEKSDKATNARLNAAPDTHVQNAILDIDAAKIRKDAETAIENDVKVREQKVYHGSQADFDHFDHSHMGEGEGAQAYGWGTYVTEVEGIGRSYAKQNSAKRNPEYTSVERAYEDAQDEYNDLVQSIADREIEISLIYERMLNRNKEKLAEFKKKGIQHWVDEYTKRVERSENTIKEAKEKVEADRKESELAEKRMNEAKARLDAMPKRNLYTVEIPDDTGENYLDWNGTMGEDNAKRIAAALEADGWKLKEEGPYGSMVYGKDGEEIDLFGKRYFVHQYRELERGLGSDKAASLLLGKAGYAGIKYPADNLRGGNRQGKKNYVIFDENDAKITDHVRFFRTSDGEAYGFTVGGRIYIDPRVANSETPIHEYAHLWSSALKRGNPKEWKNVVDLMLDTKVWDEVERNYPELKGNMDAIADEVIATYSGRRGAERLRQMAEVISSGKAFEKAQTIGTVEKVKRALEKFWKGVADMLHIHYTSAEEVADRVMKDLLDGVDPRKMMKEAVEANNGDAPTRFQKVTDKDELEKLDKEKTFRMYSGMQIIDGKLYSPMAAIIDGKRTDATEIGAWMKADERPDLVKNGKFNLVKTDKTKGAGEGDVAAAYNPYMHTSTSMMNDQFTGAYARGNIKVVEWDIPESEKTSGYKAEGAKDAVGLVPWHSGSVNGLLPKDRQRSVMLSRWRKAVRVVPDSEVAESIAHQLEDTDLAIPWNVVTPNQLKELAKLGVRITTEETGTQSPETKEAFLKQKAELEKEYPQAKFVDVKMTKDAYKEWGNGSVKKTAKKKPSADPMEGMKKAADTWREEQRVRLQKKENVKDAKEESKSEDLFVSLQNKKGKEYYDTVTELARRVSEGKARLTRLPEEYESRGVISIPQAVGRVIASAWVQNGEGSRNGLQLGTHDGSVRSSQLGKKWEESSLAQIEEWSKRNNYWINEEEYSSKGYEKNLSGSESVVYFVGDKVVKFTDYQAHYSKEGINGYLEQVTLMNAIAPDAASKIIGFSRGKDGKFRVVLEQKKFSKIFECEADEDGDMTALGEKQYDEWLEKDAPIIKRQFARRGLRYSINDQEATHKGKVAISDLWMGNIACDEKGKYHIIDGNARLLDESKAGDYGVVDNDGVHYRTADDTNSMASPVGKTVERLSEIAAKNGDKLGVKVNAVRSVEEISDPNVRKDIEGGKAVQGWYDAKTGEVHLYMPNIHCSRDAVKTVWHETVGHKGMRGLLGDKFNDYMRGLWYDLDNPVNKELHEYVLGRMRKEPMSMYDAIEEYLADAAENGKGEPNFWLNIKNKVVDALHEIGYRMQPNVKDVKYMLWLAKNVQKNPNDPMWKMRQEAVKWKIEHENFEGTKIHGGELYDNDGKTHDLSDMTKDEWLDATDGEIHYRTTPSAATALDRYHQQLDAHGYMATEAFMDNILSLKALMKAIDPSIKKIEDVASSMNPYLMQNVMEGAMADRMKLFELRVMEPLNKAMAGVLDAFEGKKTEDRIRDFNLYMIRKHGLERNRVLFVRDAVEKSGNDKLGADWSTEKARLGGELASGRIDLKEYYRQMDEWIRQNVDADYDASEHDYSGMHGLQEIADERLPYDDAGAIDKVMSQEQGMEGMKRGSVKDFWAKVKTATQYALDSDYQCGMVTKATHDRVSAMFDWYVPLRKFDEATAEDIYGYVTESGVRKDSIGATLMSAKGRKSLSNVDILAQIGVMGNRAIKNGGANTIRQAFARFVRNNGGKGLVTETKVWVEKKGTDVNGNDIWEEAYPKIPDTATADDVAVIVDAFEADMKAKEKNGLAKNISDSGNIGFKFERAKDKAQHIVDVMIAGKTHRFIINGNPRAAQALNGMLKNGGATTAGGKVLQTMTRWMAQTATSWNPEFVMRNIIRDAEFASSNVTAKEGARYGAKWTRYYAELNPLNVFGNEGAGALKSMKRRDLKGGVGYGLYARYREGTLGDSKMERYFKEFMENGGETGFVQLKNLQDLAKEYKSTVASEAAKGVKKGLINTGKVVHGLFENIEHLNEVAENMARFATFCTSRDMGRSAARSAYDAKEVSTNFNRRGSGDAIKTFKNGGMGTLKEARRNTYGFVAGYLRNYSMFFNAGIQSTNLLLKNVKNSPKTTIAEMMAVPFAMGALVPLLNQWLMNDEDENERGGVKDPYAELPDYIRRNNLCIYTGKGNFVTIPLAIELRAFYGLGDMAAGHTIAKNVKSERNMVMDGMGCVSQLFPVIDFMNSQNVDKKPVEETIKAILPTGLSPFAEWGLNSDWKGAQIRRDYKGGENLPAWKRAYNGTPDLFMWLNKKVNAKTNDIAPGNENMKGNAFLDAVTDPAMLNHIYGTLGGGSSTFTMRAGGVITKTALGKEDEVEVKDIPFIRSIVYTPTEQSSMARTKAKWYSYKSDMEVDMANYDALKSKNVPLTERIANQAAMYKFEGSKKAQRIKIIKDADKQIDRWNKLKKRVAGDKQQMDYVNRNIDMVMQEAVEQLDKIGD